MGTFPGPEIVKKNASRQPAVPLARNFPCRVDNARVKVFTAHRSLVDGPWNIQRARSRHLRIATYEVSGLSQTPPSPWFQELPRAVVCGQQTGEYRQDKVRDSFTPNRVGIATSTTRLEGATSTALTHSCKPSSRLIMFLPSCAISQLFHHRTAS